MLLDHDDDGIAPDHRSFAALRWVPPGLTVNRQGAFIAVWEIPGVFRWLLEFRTVGGIEWTVLERSSEAGVVRRTGRGQADSIELPWQLRQRTVAD